MISIKFSDIVAPRKRIRYTKKEINGEKKVTMAPCFYQSNTDRIKEIDPEELTITFACSRYPRANWTEMEVERKMCDALKELFAEELKEENERGRAEGIHLAKLIFKLSAQGSSAEEIA